MDYAPQWDAVCEYCKKIPFDSLPFEDEAAIPHQLTLRALKHSATQCALCNLILTAVHKLKQHIDRDSENSERSGIGEWRCFDSSTSPSGRKRMEVTSLGAFFQGTYIFTGDTDKLRERPEIDIPSYVDVVDEESIRPWLFGNWWKVDIQDAPLQLIGLGVRIGRTPNLEDAHGNKRDQPQEDGGLEDLVHYRGSFLRIRTDDDSPLAHLIPGRLRLSDSTSPAAFGRLISWLDSCVSKHGCAPTMATLPTRVLDVGFDVSPPYVKLVETNGQRGQYLALSHCWGTSARITATNSTLQMLKNGVHFDDLPKTFRDVAIIGRRIGIRFVWIDSLCILQDDPLDWEREASKMTSVYANSFLTVAAVASADDENGCFPPWSLRSTSVNWSPDLASLCRERVANTSPFVHYSVSSAHLKPTYLAKWPFACLEITVRGTVSKLYITSEWMPSSMQRKPLEYCIGHFGRPIDPIAGTPLGSRAWILQERLLSPRIIHYCSDQMYWECRSCILAEEGCRLRSVLSLDTVIQGQYLPLSEHGLGSNRGLSFIEGHPPAQEVEYGRSRGGWLAVVTQYTRRHLSKGFDKLPALSGLARAISSITGDSYYAWLWKGHIFEDLHWRVYAREERRVMVPDCFAHSIGEKLCDVVLPTAYRAPSWSWASLDAHIRFVPLDFDRIVAEFIDCQTIPSGIDPFGALSGGWIKLRAPLVEMKRSDPSFEPNPMHPLGLGLLVDITLSHGVSHGEAFFDVELWFPCFALFLDSSNALILREVGNSPVEKRTGGTDTASRRKEKLKEIERKSHTSEGSSRTRKFLNLFKHGRQKMAHVKEDTSALPNTPDRAVDRDASATYHRIGIAKFMRTEHQQRNEPLVDLKIEIDRSVPREEPLVLTEAEADALEYTPRAYGPMTADDVRVLVTIV